MAQRPDWTGTLWHIQGLRPQGPSPEAQVGRAVEWLAERCGAAGRMLVITSPVRRTAWEVRFVTQEGGGLLGSGNDLEEALFAACVTVAALDGVKTPPRPPESFPLPGPRVARWVVRSDRPILGTYRGEECFS